MGHVTDVTVGSVQGWERERMDFVGMLLGGDDGVGLENRSAGVKGLFGGGRGGEVQAELDVDDGSLGSEMRRRFR